MQENYLNIWNKLINNFRCLFLKKLFSSKGRASRKEYIVGLLTWFIPFYHLNEVIDYFSKSSSLIMFFLMKAYFIVTILYFVRYFFLTARRLHDLNINGWWQLISFAPISKMISVPISMLISVPLIFVIFLMFKKGTPDTNKYGEPPIK